MITEFAPAKINLYLHITGRRDDGYHLLDSLVSFATIGDQITLTKSDAFRFTVTGPQAGVLANEPIENNLVVKAARSLAALVNKPLDVAITLEKKLPVASGIGGGSSDAAAALRALTTYWGIAVTDPRLGEAASRHGQDVPACLNLAPNYLTAAGVAVAPALPPAHLILVNPNKALPTPEVYKVFRESGAAFSPLAQLSKPPSDFDGLVMALNERHNDLYAPAAWLMPDIDQMLEGLRALRGCALVRMSGSGATCFGLFKTADEATTAKTALKQAHPGWWVESGAFLS